MSGPPGRAARAPGARTAAVVDVGSNSVLLLVVSVDADGRARARDEAAATTRLGEGLVAGRPLLASAAARTAAAVEAYVRRARAAGARDVWGFGTGAARDAADGAAFVAMLAAATGVPVTVLPAAREAALAFAAAAHALGAPAGPVLVADLGGRTLELTLGHGDRIARWATLPLGALALTEAYLPGDPPPPAAQRALAAAVDEVLAREPLMAAARGATLVASGGTATTLAALDRGLARYDPRAVHGAVLAAGTLDRMAARLAGLPAAARGGLHPGRAAILPAGATVLARLAAALAAPALRVSDHGVRHAYLRERLAETGDAPDLRELWS